MIEQIDKDTYKITTTIIKEEIVHLPTLQNQLASLKKSNAEAKANEDWALTLSAKKQKCVILLPQIDTKELEKLIEDINGCKL